MDASDISSEEENVFDFKNAETAEGGLVQLEGATADDQKFIDVSDDDLNLVNSYNRQAEYRDEIESDASEDDGSDYISRIKKMLFEKGSESISNGIHMLYQHMLDIAKHDAENFAKGIPAIEKTSTIDAISKFLKYEALSKNYIEGRLLEAIEEWLKPYPDQTLPSNNVREKLYDVLNTLPVDRDTISNSTCQISKLLLVLYKHPHETTSNREILRRLIEKWIRLFYNKSDNYKDISLYQADSTYRNQGNVSQKILTSKELAGLPDEFSNERHATLPRKYMDNFVVNVSQSSQLLDSQTKFNDSNTISEIKRNIEKSTKRKRQTSTLPQMKVQKPN